MAFPIDGWFAGVISTNHEIVGEDGSGTYSYMHTKCTVGDCYNLFLEQRHSRSRGGTE